MKQPLVYAVVDSANIRSVLAEYGYLPESRFRGMIRFYHVYVTHAWAALIACYMQSLGILSFEPDTNLHALLKAASRDAGLVTQMQVMCAMGASNSELYNTLRAIVWEPIRNA